MFNNDAGGNAEKEDILTIFLILSFVWCFRWDQQKKRCKGQSHHALMVCSRNDRGMLGKAIRGAQCVFNSSMGVSCMWWVTWGRRNGMVVVCKVREVIGCMIRAGWRSELHLWLCVGGVCINVKQTWCCRKAATICLLMKGRTQVGLTRNRTAHGQNEDAWETQQE